jgi:hypothetical protein
MSCGVSSSSYKDNSLIGLGPKSLILTLLKVLFPNAFTFGVKRSMYDFFFWGTYGTLNGSYSHLSLWK